MRGHREGFWAGRETGVKKAVFRLTALHPVRFETFLGRPPRTQVRILWGWGEGWGVHGASGSGRGGWEAPTPCISDWIILRILKGDTSGKRPSLTLRRRSGEIEPQEEDHSSGLSRGNSHKWSHLCLFLVLQEELSITSLFYR